MVTSDRKRGRAREKEETLVFLEKWGQEHVQQNLRDAKERSQYGKR